MHSNNPHNPNPPPKGPPLKPTLPGIARPGALPPKPPTPQATARFTLPGANTAPRSGLSVCLQGKPFSGKTQAMVTWPNWVLFQFDERDDTAVKATANGVILYPTLDEWALVYRGKVANKTLDAYIRTLHPSLVNFTVKTILFDTWTSYASRVSAAEGLKSPAVTKSGKDNGFARWGALLDVCKSTAMALAEATRPNADGKFYHVVAGIHETDEYDTDGNLIAIGPSLQGKFKDNFFSQFGTVLSLSVKSGTAGPVHVASSTKTTLRPSMGDRVGGGRYGTLPGDCAPDYPSLMRAWGFPMEPNEPLTTVDNTEPNT